MSYRSYQTMNMTQKHTKSASVSGKAGKVEKIRRTMEATAASRLDALFASIVKHFAPPEDISVSEWADKYRVLSTENAAEAGQ